MFLAFIFSLIPFAEADLIPIDFENQISTCLSTERLWEQLEVSMLDSKKGWLWPEGKSTVQGEGLAEKSKIFVTYNTIFSDPTYTYELSNVVELKTFTYSAVKGAHPFLGGATVDLFREGNVSILSWKGQYLTQDGDWLERRFFKSFSKDFFKALEENIKNNEHFCIQDNEL